MVNHELVLKPGDTLTVTVADSNARSTTAPLNNNDRNLNNFEGGSKKNRTRKAGGAKKPLSGFMKFCKEKRPEVMRENPGIEFQNVGKELGKKWRALSEAEKKRY
jgi:protein involved in polysaccharide export with SLBB domain